MRKVWLAITVALGVGVVWLGMARVFVHTRSASEQGTRPPAGVAPVGATTTEARPAAPAERNPEGDATVDQEVPVPSTAMDAADNKVKEASAKAAADLDIQVAMASKKQYWQAEDEALAKMPKYDDVRDEYLKKAADALTTIDTRDQKAVVDLAQTELDRFWAQGSISVQDNYTHAYLARAIIDTSLQKSPDDFQLLCALKETVSAVTPLFNCEQKTNGEGVAVLWDVVNRQKTLIESGKVPPSVDAMKAMYDWTNLNYRKTNDAKAAMPVWQWLIDNAQAGGWSKALYVFKAGLEAAQKGRIYVQNIDIIPFGPTPKDMVEQKRMADMYGRRLMSLTGGRNYRKAVIHVWQLSEDPLRRM